MEDRRAGMKYKRFYQGKVDEKILELIDAEYKNKIEAIIEELKRGAWSDKQRKRQISSIIPNIALYKSFIAKGVSKDEAKKLVKEYSFYKAKRFHNILKTLFYIPGFFRIFRFFMKQGMAGDEIWESRILSNDVKCYRVDVLKCLWANTCEYFKCPEICEVFCLCDHIVFGDIDGFVFERSRTLGMKGEKCDFCFKSRSTKAI